MKRSWNNKTKLQKDGVIHQLDRLNKELVAIPVKKTKKKTKK